jgi:hypothetical protein
MEVLTSPFHMQHLIYWTIVSAFESAGPKAELEVSIQTTQFDHVRISLTGLGSEGVRNISIDEVNRIADSIGSRVEIAYEPDVVEILVPKHPDDQKK